MEKYTSSVQFENQAIPEIDYQSALDEFLELRGRGLFYPTIQSGLGRGPLYEQLNGEVKYDMVTGIGVNFFGHSHPRFASTLFDGVVNDVMQGNLQPGVEATVFLRRLIDQVSKKSRLEQGWIMGSGTMVNEVALKILRQKKSPASKIIAFEDCFCGRSTAMQEITDNPKYRQGQPTYGIVDYIPHYHMEDSLDVNIERTVSALKVLCQKEDYVGLMIELVQGEGGFSFGPKDYYVAVFEEAKKQGLYIWADEIQTFGRTGELFCYQTFGLDEYVDLVTAGKMLQSCVVLYTKEICPQPGLVAGTFAGSTSALRTAKVTLDLLLDEGFLGPEGKIQKLSDEFRKQLESLSSEHPHWVSQIRILGGMIAFQPFDGSMERVKSFLFKLFEAGVVAFSCGHGPYLVRMLPPFGVMTKDDISKVVSIIESTLEKEASE